MSGLGIGAPVTTPAPLDISQSGRQCSGPLSCWTCYWSWSPCRSGWSWLPPGPLIPGPPQTDTQHCRHLQDRSCYYRLLSHNEEVISRERMRHWLNIEMYCHISPYQCIQQCPETRACWRWAPPWLEYWCPCSRGTWWEEKPPWCGPVEEKIFYVAFTKMTDIIFLTPFQK